MAAKKKGTKAAKMVTKKKTKNKRDDLASAIVDQLNKESDDTVAYLLEQGGAAPTLFTKFISTGCAMLDLAISNRPHGGIAAGRITELQGNEGSGKSLIAAHMMKDTQQRGGVAILFDTETAVNFDFFDAIGLDMNNMVYVHENRLEIIFEQIEGIIHKVRAADSNRLVIIVVDSVAGATTQAELESDHGKDGYATEKSIVISKALRKITKIIADQNIALVFTNQLRQKMNAMPFADPYTTPGGKGINFHASTQVRLALAGTVKDTKTKDAVAVKVKAKVIKNRLGPNYRTAEFNVFFDSGIDDYGSWFDVMKKHKLIKSSGAWSTWDDPETGDTIKFQRGTFYDILLKDDERRERVYDQIAEAAIKKYRAHDQENYEEENKNPKDFD